MKKSKLLWQWLRARRTVLLYVAAVFGLFFLVYALYGYPWGVAGYAALLAAALGAVLAVLDIARFAQRHRALVQAANRFPTSQLPPPANLIQQDYGQIITALETERARLEKAGERANRDAQEYYTLWAHQIKTPIAAMRLLLQSGAGISDQKAKGDLGQELFRIEQYVDMVLQYQRLSSLQNDLVLEQHSLASLVKQAGKNCANLYIYKGLALHTNDVYGAIVSDEKWFGFVLEQLLTNAAKYANGREVRVYCAGENTLVVEDFGIGIPKEDLPRVFERGFTGTVGRAERSSTGIGLYLCRQILLRLGFGISIESRQGKGTRVLLHLGQNALELE